MRQVTDDDFFTLAVLRYAVEQDIIDDILWGRWVAGKHEKLLPSIKCSDTFSWGCADCEALTPDNFDLLKQCCAEVEAVDKYPYHGPLLFCCRTRKERPMLQCYKELPATIRPLIDACGPERGNG